MSLGETYIFACHSNLNHIVFPLSNNERPSWLHPYWTFSDGHTGFPAAGKTLPNAYDIPTIPLLELYEEANTLPLLEPSKVTHISRLLFYMFSGLVIDSRNQFMINHNKLYQQSKINESIQQYKATEHIHKRAYPYGKGKKR